MRIKSPPALIGRWAFFCLKIDFRKSSEQPITNNNNSQYLTMSTTITKTDTTTENGELKQAFSDLIGNLNRNPEGANLAVAVSSTLTDGLVANIKVRDFEIVADEPEAIGGTDTGPNPVECVLAGLASCQQIAIKAHATVLGIDVDEVTVEAEGELDLQGFLGLSDARPGLDRKSTRLNSSHVAISYAVFCLKKKSNV